MTIRIEIASMMYSLKILNILDGIIETEAKLDGNSITFESDEILNPVIGQTLEDMRADNIPFTYNIFFDGYYSQR